MTQNRTLSLILPAFGAAIIATLAQIVIPIGAVPITLQTFAVGLVAAILKPREATLAATLYLILGAIGLPVYRWYPQPALSWKDGLVCSCSCRFNTLYHPRPFKRSDCRFGD